MPPPAPVADIANAWTRYNHKAVRLERRDYLFQPALQKYLANFEKLNHFAGDTERLQYFRELPSLEALVIAADAGLSPQQRQSLAQQQRAQKSRVRIGGDGKTMTEIVGEFCLRPENYDKSAKVVWPRFFTELQALKLDPIKVTDGLAGGKETYFYDDEARYRRKLSERTFANLVSRTRRNKNSR